MATWIWRLGAAGVWFSALELLVVVLCDRSLFLSSLELWRYGLFACALLPTVLVTAGLLSFGVHRGLGSNVRRSERLLFWMAASSSWPLAWSLTAGRRVRDMPLRPLWVSLAALLAGSAVYWGVRWLHPRLRGPGAAGWAVGLLALCTLTMLVDSMVLRRLYEDFHLALAVGACGLSLLASLGLGFLPAPSLPPRACFAIPALLWFLTGIQWIGLMSAPNARFAVEQAAPVSGKLLALSSWLRPSATAPSQLPPFAGFSAAGGMTPSGPGVDLRQRDVLLISIDALRADRLAAYGGSGLTPAMDALAQQSLVFERAYTTAPHTSYAMASLMTAKYMREVLALPGRGEGHVTLAQTVRRYGYRTAAFYPPALFFVDEDAFAELSQEQFGFEYVKVMFASAQERVEQLRTYLDKVPRDYPLLLWVHLFEPHEPYEPAPEFARGSTPLQRYDGEVAQADAAVGKLLELVRRRSGQPPLVVLTADHGEEFQDHGGYRHGTTLFDEQVRVPLLFSAPGTITAGRSRVAVDHVDIATTVLAALGMPREARMRGDDLGPILAGRDVTGLRAYASVDAQRMVTDGRHKLICGAHGDCRLYDLQMDPHERRDVSEQRPERLAELRATLSQFAATIAEREALDVEGTALPEVLSRVTLGERVKGAEVTPLLGDLRPGVRALAASTCGELGYRPALALLHNLAAFDPQLRVRQEAMLALFRLGEQGPEVDMTALLTAGRDRGLRRRAALALAEVGDPLGLSLLRELAADVGAEEAARRAAVAALGRLSRGPEAEASAKVLISLLPEVRLRPHVAAALGMIGTPRARQGLLAALADERYLDCRVAEAQALTALGERRVVPLLLRFLGTDSGLPGGLAALQRLSALAPSGGVLAREPARARDGFECDENECSIRGTAALRLRRALTSDAARLVLEVTASDEAELTSGDQTQSLQQGSQQVSFVLERGARDISLRAKGTVRVVRFGVFAVRADVAPPPPEPWSATQVAADAGAPEEAHAPVSER